ncbi:hypothetical protein LX36DRAFT_303718 [Colletotrichum falcatum]|nr:hypothetical protein LX36DRAFT_303718 [Colletotrichum falcatum]
MRIAPAHPTMRASPLMDPFQTSHAVRLCLWLCSYYVLTACRCRRFQTVSQTHSPQLALSVRLRFFFHCQFPISNSFYSPYECLKPT